MDRINEIRERASKATDGPWESGYYGSVCLKSGYKLCNVEGQANADFIAHSRSDIEFLLSEIDRLTSLLAEQQADIDATDAADRELHAAWESQNKEIDRLKAEQSNEPLTLEALRQMDGKPAYFQFGTGSCGYAVISWETESSLMLYAPDLPDDMYPDICFINMEYNDPDGHFGLHLLGWRAHRRKPEGGEG